MSTVLEAIAAREAGAEVLGISLVTNLAAGMTGEPLNHEEVLQAGRDSAARMGALLAQVLEPDLSGDPSSPPALPGAHVRTTRPGTDPYRTTRTRGAEPCRTM